MQRSERQGGIWITDDGHIKACDHPNDRHHSHIAFEHYLEQIEANHDGEHDKYSLEIAVGIAYDAGWIRISTRGFNSIDIEWRSDPSTAARQSLFS